MQIRKANVLNFSNRISYKGNLLGTDKHDSGNRVRRREEATRREEKRKEEEMERVEDIKKEDPFYVPDTYLEKSATLRLLFVAASHTGNLNPR